MSRILIGLGVLGTVGCLDAATFVNVSATTDLTDCSWLELRVLSSDGVQVVRRAQREWSSGVVQSFNFRPLDGDLSTSPEAGFEAVAGSCAPEDGRIPDRCILVTQRTRVRYVAGATVWVRLVLAASCRGVPCGDGSTCVDGVCTDVRIEPTPVADAGM